MKLKNVLVVFGALTLLAACGTRLPDSAFKSTAQQQVRSTDNGNGGDTFGDTGGDTTETTLFADSGGSGGGGGSSSGNGGGTKTGGGGSTDSGPNKASDVGVTENSIAIGTIVAENGVLGDAFAPTARGMRAWAAYINAHGGIRGRQVVLKTCDDREDRNRDLACAQQLVEKDKVFALIGTNTRSFGGSAQYLADHEIPVLGEPITNSFARYPTMFSVYQNGYARDGKNVGYKGQLVNTSGIYRWFKQKLNVSKAAVFAYDIDESKQAGQFIQKGLQLEGYSQADLYIVSFAAPSFDQAVAEMQSKGTEIIFDAMDDGANRKLCDAMARRTYQPKAKVSTIVSMGDRVGTDYNDTCRNIVFIPGSTLNYQATSNPEIKKFRDAYARYQPNQPLHQWAYEAWMMGNLFKSYADSAAPTRKGFVAYLNGLHDWKADGTDVGLDWGKTDPSASRVKDCFSIARWLDAKGGWTQATDSFPQCYSDAYQFLTPTSEQGN